MIGEDDEEFMWIGRAVVADDWATNILAAIEAHKINMTRQATSPSSSRSSEFMGRLGGSRHGWYTQASRTLENAE